MIEMGKRLSNLIGTELSLFHHPRWRFDPVYDDEYTEVEGVFRLTVVTPEGIYPRAAGHVIISKELAGDRRHVAMFLKAARHSYNEFRRTHR